MAAASPRCCRATTGFMTACRATPRAPCGGTAAAERPSAPHLRKHAAGIAHDVGAHVQHGGVGGLGVGGRRRHVAPLLCHLGEPHHHVLTRCGMGVVRRGRGTACGLPVSSPTAARLSSATMQHGKVYGVGGCAVQTRLQHGHSHSGARGRTGSNRPTCGPSTAGAAAVKALHERAWA
jgi:hypothetical protein